MEILKLLLFSLTAFAFDQSESAQTFRLFPGYNQRIECQGRLFVSSVGNDSLVRLEALPKEVGCGVILKPLLKSGRTNLILETSSGSSNAILVIEPSAQNPLPSQLQSKVITEDHKETKSP